MRSIVIKMLACLISISATAQQTGFENYPVYNGKDLGLVLTSSTTSFKVWAPTADSVELRLYKTGEGGVPEKSLWMNKDQSGTWSVLLNQSLKGWFYTYKAFIKGRDMNEVPDPYAFATGVNGKRTAIIDIKEAAPINWQQDKTPPGLHPVDAVIYELHVRDASIHETGGMKVKGKFISFTERGTKNKEGYSTGIDHIRELGVTHVHLLPFFDFLSIDETRADKPQYNWGYEPLNYNVPEGSYSTNPYEPATRIKELREMVMAFHANNLRVVMDVVYNHTMLTEDSWFNQLVPGYYYRQNASGGFSNATACGNEVASERPMVRKYILESLEFWMQQYKLDGFRFDLMGVHDISLMQEIEKTLKAINPYVLLYGEGWAAGESPMPENQRALKKMHRN
ncbi:MAG: type I pullulanase [Chitinophagaceae bacterium]|nr:type I pullulanase [Chitinophagaceae bacterium]